MTQNHSKRRPAGAAQMICLAALLIMLLSGCGGQTVFDGSRTADRNGFRMDYSVLSREETADLELSEGDLLRVVLEHSSGSVDIIIGIEGQEAVYRGTEQQNAEFTLTIPETGVYHISVTGLRAFGRVSFTRVQEEQEP